MLDMSPRNGSRNDFAFGPSYAGQPEAYKKPVDVVNLHRRCGGMLVRHEKPDKTCFPVLRKRILLASSSAVRSCGAACLRLTARRVACYDIRRDLREPCRELIVRTVTMKSASFLLLNLPTR